MECPICREEVSAQDMRPHPACGEHPTCVTCRARWEAKNNTCPFCRRVPAEEEDFEIYMESPICIFILIHILCYGVMMAIRWPMQQIGECCY
jgi:hypothetical protein